MRLGLLLQGRDTDTIGVWDFAYGTDWNSLAGAMPEQADLDAVLGEAERIALPRPWFLMAHSMGGCIGLRALVRGAPFRAADRPGSHHGSAARGAFEPVR